MSSTLSLPILRNLVPGGIDYGASLLVEFEPRSLWYETSLTIAAHALRNGVPTGYHTFQHIPGEVRSALARHGLNVKELQDKDLLSVIDSYTIQTGLGVPETRGPSSTSLKLSDWSIEDAKHIRAGIPESEKRHLHIDDNILVLLDYNQEKEFIDYYRTRLIPFARAHEMTVLHAVVIGVASESFYKKFESLCDGIIEFRSDEKGGQIEQYVRVSAMRGRTYDSRWRKLQLLDNGEVTVAD